MLDITEKRIIELEDHSGGNYPDKNSEKHKDGKYKTDIERE